MKALATLLAAATLAAALPAGANEQPAAAPAAKPSSGRLVCFTEPVTGSHMRKRVCMTEEERDRRRTEDQEALRKFKGGSGARGSAGADPGMPSPR